MVQLVMTFSSFTWNHSNATVSSLVPKPSRSVFVTCSTTTVEGLAKLITCTDRGWRVDIWKSGSFWNTTSKWVHYWSQPPTTEQLRSQHQAVSEKFLRFRRPPTAVPKSEATSPMSAMPPHVSLYLPPLLCTASNLTLRRPVYGAVKEFWYNI